ncbi:hypothetical protein Aglo03_25760 [Actinokineospora globicatena]|uniref:Uncharacterized protein n=1 Tax=Actinokineospora globicatena TaxID=103729 RepID=A0A9W6V6N2_9PSEU|nr:hypothetical protein Aglo03_25760 [Actinokineospora globicatena]
MRDGVVHIWRLTDPVPGRVRETECGLSAPTDQVAAGEGASCERCLVAFTRLLPDFAVWQQLAQR